MPASHRSIKAAGTILMLLVGVAPAVTQTDYADKDGHDFYASSALFEFNHFYMEATVGGFNNAGKLEAFQSGQLTVDTHGVNPVFVLPKLPPGAFSQTYAMASFGNMPTHVGTVCEQGAQTCRGEAYNTSQDGKAIHSLKIFSPFHGSTGNDALVTATPYDDTLVAGVITTFLNNTSRSSLIFLTPQLSLDTSLGNKGMLDLGTGVVRTVFKEGQGAFVLVTRPGSTAVSVHKYLNVETGTLDHGFGNQGTVEINVGNPDLIVSQLLVKDGSVYIVAGEQSGVHLVTLMKLHPDGKVDTNYGTPSFVIDHGFGNTFVQEALLLDDGTPVFSGTVVANHVNKHFSLALTHDFTHAQNVLIEGQSGFQVSAAAVVPLGSSFLSLENICRQTSMGEKCEIKMEEFNFNLTRNLRFFNGRLLIQTPKIP